MPSATVEDQVRRLILSGSVSCITLSLLFGLVAGHSEMGPAAILDALRHISLAVVGVYLVSQFAQAAFRAARYRLLLRMGGEAQVPRFGHMFLVTIARNMLVDLLPARAGELGYVAMLNRGCRVSVEGGLSSLAMSMLFDLIALALVLVLLIAPMLWRMAGGRSMAGAGALLGMALAVAWWAWFHALPAVVRQAWFRRLTGRTRWTARAGAFFDHLAGMIVRTRTSGAMGSVLGLSAGVRLAKYVGLYVLFMGVTRGLWPAMAELPPWAVLGTLIAAEGAASLPVPTLMSFGTYEAGGVGALTLLGFAAADAAFVMLVVHVAGQALDYTLGGIAMLLFTYRSPRAHAVPAAPEAAPAALPRARRMRAWAFTLVLAALAVAMALHTALRARALGALTPPERGAEQTVPDAAREVVRAQLDGARGFVVWSSNRHGSHDLLRMDLPKMTIRRLTSDEHTDTYPRLCPEGRRVVFCRSQIPWVSQRDPVPWDLWLLDLETGAERLLAKHGFQPSWTADGAAVVFVRHGTQVVEHRLADGAETVLLESGQGKLPAGLKFQTPYRHPAHPELAVTVRGRRRAAALIAPGGGLDRVISAHGCQLAWAPDGAFVYWADKGGRMGLRFYTARPEAPEPVAWLDLAGEHSHQYFPKLSADGRFLVMGASAGGHEHDTEDYEVYLWNTATPPEAAVRLTFHTGNDCWPDVHLIPRGAESE
jgi:hypothetical protein